MDVVLVTGAARGIGEAIARRFAEDGYKVVATDLKLEEVQEAARTMRGEVYPLVEDVTKPDQIRAVAEQIERMHGRLDVLVNNAGILLNASFEESTEAQWDATFDVNVKGVVRVTQASLHLLRRSQHPAIINVASVGGKWGAPGQSAYCSSKAAVIELTRVLAMELGPSIRCNCVCPGIIETQMGMVNLQTPELVQMWTQRALLARLGQPDDVADVVRFLASNDSRYMTGQAINVTGGMFLW